MKIYFLILIIACTTCCKHDVQAVREEKIWLGGRMEETQFQNLYKVCLDSVYYWSGFHSLAVAYNQDGTVQTCVWPPVLYKENE